MKENPHMTKYDKFPQHNWNYAAKLIILRMNGINDFRSICGMYKVKKAQDLLIVESDLNSTTYSTCMPSRNYQMQLLGTGKSIQLNKINLFPNRFANLNGSIIRVSTFEHPPAVMYNKRSDGSISKRLGVDMNLIASLERNLNFKAKFTEAEKGTKWGYV